MDLKLSTLRLNPSASTLFLDLNNNRKPRKSLSLKKCLFGTPDPLESKTLLQEEFSNDRIRILRRYDIDLDRLNSIDEDREVLLKENRSPSTEGGVVKERNVGRVKRLDDGRKPYSVFNWKQQKLMTDFCGTTSSRPTTLKKA